MKEAGPIGAYYARLGHWTAVARVFGYGGGRETLTIHRALADPLAGGRLTTTRLHDLIIKYIGSTEHVGSEQHLGSAQASSPRVEVLAVDDLDVLDAGCGFGGTMIALWQRFGGRYTGLTLSESQAATGRRAVERLGLGDAIGFRVQSYDVPPAGPFDLIVAIESLAHSPHPAVSVAALARVLSPGGRLIVVDDMPETAGVDEPVDLEASRGRVEADDAENLRTFKNGWQCPVLWNAAQYREAFATLGLAPVLDVDLTSSCRPRSLARIRWLERLNRAVRVLVPAAAWRSVLDSYRAGLALERLHRSGRVRYRLLVAERSSHT